MLEIIPWVLRDPFARWRDDGRLAVAEGVAGLRTVMVNVYFVDHSRRDDGQENGWVLVDTGMPMTAHCIQQAAETFGISNCPGTGDIRSSQSKPTRAGRRLCQNLECCPLWSLSPCWD